jgi:hypothetical protein
VHSTDKRPPVADDVNDSERAVLNPTLIQFEDEANCIEVSASVPKSLTQKYTYGYLLQISV